MSELAVGASALLAISRFEAACISSSFGLTIAGISEK